MARALCEAMREHGGLLTEEDLHRYRATVTDYRGHQVAGVAGPAGCVTVQQSLNILEGFTLPVAGDPVQTLNLKAEAFRLAFADRYGHLGDPRHVPVPSRGLLSKAYAAERRDRIDPARAALEQEPGNPWAFEPHTLAVPSASAPWADGGPACTTHVCAVDGERNVVTLTLTLVDYFGCAVIVPGTGVLLNNAMLWFDPRSGRPNSVAPGKRGVHNMAPLLVLRDGRPLLAVGAPGGRRIINAMAQIVMNVLDEGMGVQEAITVPRIDCSGPTVLGREVLSRGV